MADEYFNDGAKIPLISGDDAVIVKRLGEGGQGVVYSVTIGGKPYALKWYKRGAIKNPDAFYKNLDYNIGKGPPAPSFLWPLYLTARGNRSFGYVMDLRPGNYREFADYLLTKVRFGSISAALTACLNITHGFRELHRAGFSYQDLNDGNFFIDPSNGDVMICDNDNVAPFGENLGIAGKARYMAPEVVRGLKKPDKQTDRFSLAVILFRILFLDHPLEGKRVLDVPCLTEELELRFYGEKPVFIYDPGDDSNRPVRGVHSNAIKLWPLFPKRLQDMFAGAFAKETMAAGPSDATDDEWQSVFKRRVNSTAWQKTFTQLRDMLIECPCGGETFFDPSGDSATCINCQKNIPRPSVLSVMNEHKVVEYEIVLFPGKKLYRCHTENGSDDYENVHGEVIRNPSNPGIWGLRNLGREPWTVTALDGATKQVAQNEVLVIPKTKAIDFGTRKATIVT